MKARHVIAILTMTGGVCVAQPEDQPQAPASPAPVGVPMLFTPAQGAETYVPRDWMTPIARVRLNEAPLLAAGVGTIVAIPVTEAISYTAVVRRVSRYADRRLIVSGGLLEADDAEFAVALFDDAIALSLRIPSRAESYGVRFMGGGEYTLYRINEAELPPCEGGLEAAPEPPRILPEDDDDYVPPAPPGYDDRYGGGCTAGTPMIDTMVVYTANARDEAGGHSAIRAVAALGVDQTSQSYINSNCPARARLVYADEIAYTEVNNNTDLNRLTNLSDGFMDNIDTLRDSLNADLVVLYTTVGSGLAWCGSSYSTAFGTLDWTRATSDFTHAHETGHNMGCAHDAANVDCNPTPAYGFGWRFIGTNGTQYRTVMAYPPGTVIMYYSNPGITYQGTATGIATADNHRAINDNARDVEGFELTRFDIYVEIGASPIVEIGTYVFPYNTLAEGVAAIAVPSTGAAETPNLYLRNSTTANLTISKEMTILPCGGAVTIGSP